MNSGVEVAKELERIGLTRREAMVYAVLLDRGRLSYDGIINSCKVPYGHVYEVTRSLEQKGFIRTIGGRPKLFEAFDISRALTGYFAKTRESLMRTLGRPTEHILTMMQDFSPSRKVSFASLEDDEISSVWTVEGAKDVKFAATMIIDTAEKEILWATPRMTPLLMEPEGEHAQFRALRRGVRQRGIIGQNYEEAQKFWLEFSDKEGWTRFIRASTTPAFQMKYLDDLHGRFLIGDRRCAVIGSPEDMSVVTCVWSKTLCKLLEDHFEELWSKGKPFLPAGN